MRTTRFLCSLVLTALVALPAVLRAQDDGPPETRVLTISTAHMPPIGPERQKLLRFITRVIAPGVRNNPNVLSYRVATHYWGSNSGDIVILAEYADWASVEAPCGDPCREWAEANIPAEGTPEREEFDEQAAAWTKYYLSKHSDDIYSVNMRRAK